MNSYYYPQYTNMQNQNMQQSLNPYQNNPYLNNNYNYLNGYQMQDVQGMYSMNGMMQNETLNGKYVDSIDVVKAQNVDMSGNVTWYPRSDRNEVYCKGLNPNTGASYILTYKLVEENDIQNVDQIDNNKLCNMIIGLQNDMNELKNIVLDNITSPSPPKIKPNNGNNVVNDNQKGGNK